MKTMMTEDKAREIARNFLKVRCVPLNPGTEECLTTLILETWKDGCNWIMDNSDIKRLRGEKGLMENVKCGSKVVCSYCQENDHEMCNGQTYLHCDEHNHPISCHCNHENKGVITPFKE